MLMKTKINKPNGNTTTNANSTEGVGGGKRRAMSVCRLVKKYRFTLYVPFVLPSHTQQQLYKTTKEGGKQCACARSSEEASKIPTQSETVSDNQIVRGREAPTPQKMILQQNRQNNDTPYHTPKPPSSFEHFQKGSGFAKVSKSFLRKMKKTPLAIRYSTTSEGECASPQKQNKKKGGEK